MKHPPVSDELVITFDVDKTLVFDGNAGNGIKMDYYGQSKWVQFSRKHIEFLKSLRTRGYYIIVWSGNGKQWADEVVDKLNIRQFVSQTLMKPLKYVDDLDCTEWMGHRIYLEDEEK